MFDNAEIHICRAGFEKSDTESHTLLDSIHDKLRRNHQAIIDNAVATLPAVPGTGGNDG